MALQPGANGSLPGVPANAPATHFPSFLLPRTTGKRTSMGAFAPWGLVTSPMTSELAQRPQLPLGAPSFSPAAEPTAVPLAQGRYNLTGAESVSSLDSLIAAVLNQRPTFDIPRPGGGETEVANGNRLSPVREFPVSPAAFTPIGAGVQSPGGLKPEVLKMLLSKPLHPFQNRPVTQNRPGDPVHTSAPQAATVGVKSPVEGGSPLPSPVVPASRSGSNPSLPFKKRTPSNGSRSATSASQGAMLDTPASEGINSPSLPETKPFQSTNSGSTNPRNNLVKSTSDTSSQSVSPERRVRNGLAATPIQVPDGGFRTEPGLKQRLEERKRQDETDVLKAMLSARERELEAVRRERDAVQLMAAATKSLLERKDEVIEALKERVAALEARSHVGTRGTTESEEIALAALTHLQGEERKARAATFRRPRTPSSVVAVGGDRVQRIRSFSSPLGRSVSKSNLRQRESAGSGFNEESKADGRTPAGADGRGSKSPEGSFEDANGQSDVLEALMALQGGACEGSPEGGVSQSSGEARLPKRAETVRLSGEASAGAEGPSKKRKLETGRELFPGDDEPGEVVASPILLRLPGQA